MRVKSGMMAARGGLADGVIPVCPPLLSPLASSSECSSAGVMHWE
jgi:hypothetical protein